MTYDRQLNENGILMISVLDKLNIKLGWILSEVEKQKLSRVETHVCNTGNPKFSVS